MDLLQTLLVYMSLVFASSVQTAPEPIVIPETPDYAAAVVEFTPAPSPVPTPVPTIDITPNPAYKTIQTGDRGDAVRDMQEKLQEYGYYAGEIDGAYGNQTRLAVEQFQYMHGLSVDGIAGRRTLTVLYESTEIRLPRGQEATPEPTATAQLAPALTPPPQVEASFIPIATATPVPSAAKEPVAEKLPVEEMDGYVISVNGVDTKLKAYDQGETIFLPMLELLKCAGVNVISSSTVEMDEYAFASGFAFVRVTHTENQQGEPVDLQAYRNDEPQLVPNRTLYRADGVLYVPSESIEKIAGMICETDGAAKRINVVSAE